MFETYFCWVLEEAVPDRIFSLQIKYFTFIHINAIPVMTASSDTASSQVITEYGKQNIFGRETQPQLVEDYTSYPEEAEKTNGRWAMIGMVSLLVSYFTTGQIIPGIFWALIHPLILAITSTLLKSSNQKKQKKQMVVGQWSALLLY